MDYDTKKKIELIRKIKVWGRQMKKSQEREIWRFTKGKERAVK